MPRGLRPAAPLVVAVALVVGCGREPAFPDRTARVTLDGQVTTFQVDGCGRDGETVYVVGRTDDGQVLQAVVGVEGDGATGVPASTGVTVTVGEGGGVAAFGAEAWARRGQEGDPPGAVAGARVRGARIQAEGRAQPLDGRDRPRPGPWVPLALDARCDQRDG